MRTKHLLTAMVLPALFAACTNEEIDVVKSTASLNERAIVENVTFNFSDQAASRLTYNGKYVWQAGDQIGACLMDEIVDPTYWDFTAKWTDRFTLVDYIQTNYKFSRNADGEWATEAKMCEGNYFLAFPYDANQGIRAAYRFSCADQTLENTTTAALMDAFAKNNSFVGYAQVKQGANESVAVDMVPVFESTGFTLKNTGTNSYTIEKIVLHGAKVYSEAVIDPTNSNYSWFDANQKHVLVYSLNRGTSGRIDVAIEGGNVVAPQASINVIVMSGTAALAADADAYLEIHTDKGLIRGINLNEKQTADNGVLGNGATVNVLTDKALAELGKGDKVNVTFDDTSIDIPNEMDIYSSDELYNLIKWNAAVKNVDVIANLQAPVALTAEMYNILKNSGAYGDGKSTLTIKGDYSVTINANVPQDGIDLVKFANSKIFIAGTQTITTGTAPYTRQLIVPVEVLKGATFNVQANVNNTVENFGTVAAKKANGKITKLINRGTATVDANLSTELINLGTVTNNATLYATGDNYGTLENKGTLAANAGAVLENMSKDLYYDNVKYDNPTINNYGKILAVKNNNVIVMKDKEARINEANGTGEIDNTIQSDYIASGVANIVFVKVADMTATELHEIVLNADATKAYVSGSLTIDPATVGGEVKVTKVTAIVAEGDLTITGKGKVWFSESPSFTVAAKTETVVDNGSTLSIKDGELNVYGLLTIKNNAKVICGEANGQIENYGELKENHIQAPVTGVQGLKDALSNGDDVKLETDITISSNSETESNAYGKTGINVTNGQTINGNGNTLNVPAATGTWDSAINTTGGLIKNLTIASGFRGVFVNHNSSNCSKVILENVIIDGPVYTISCDQGTNNGLDATNCTFNGWTSYAATIGDVTFTDCSFGEGAGYAYCRPYAPTTFTNCKFEEGYKLDARATVIFNNCSLNGVILTDANISDLISGGLSNVTVQ